MIYLERLIDFIFLIMLKHSYIMILILYMLNWLKSFVAPTRVFDIYRKDQVKYHFHGFLCLLEDLYILSFV